MQDERVVTEHLLPRQENFEYINFLNICFEDGLNRHTLINKYLYLIDHGANCIT